MSTYGQKLTFGPYFSNGALCTLKIYHYIAGTTSLLNGYTTREKTGGTEVAQPLVSDANGIASAFWDGIYKFRIDGSTDGSTYSTIYTEDNWAVGDQNALTTGEGAALTSATTLTLGTDGTFFHVSGSTGPIGLISGSPSEVTLIFDSTPTLTHSVNLILRDAVDYTVTAGDVLKFFNDGAGVWRESSRHSITTATRTYVDNFHQLTTASYTSTSGVAVNVNLALLSGASFALTLPAAASYSGREITIVHQGTSLTQVYTVTGNGAENIIAKDGTATTYILYTAGEEITVKSNGTGWQVMHHLSSTEWANVGAMTITGTTSDPTKPTTPDLDKVYWRRSGNHVYLRYILQTSSASGSAAGSGNYLFALPTNITFDSTVMAPVATTLAGGTRSEASSSFLNGVGMAGVDSASFNQCTFYAQSTSTFQVYASGTINNEVGSTAVALTNAELSYNFELEARAANWRL